MSVPIRRPGARTPVFASGMVYLLSLTQASGASLYDQWKNGPPTSPDFFPIAVWWQNPALHEKSGTYPDIGHAASAMGINIILGIGGWPERFGGDDGELKAARDNGLLVIGGIDTPWNENTSPHSVASVLALAKAEGATRNVIGYNAGDEPTCKPDTMQAAKRKIEGIASYDPTRVVTYNQTTWMISPQWLGACATNSFAALRAASIGSFDFYPATGPWFPQILGYPKGDFATIANDSLWGAGYGHGRTHPRWAPEPARLGLYRSRRRQSRFLQRQ